MASSTGAQFPEVAFTTDEAQVPAKVGSKFTKVYWNPLVALDAIKSGRPGQYVFKSKSADPTRMIGSTLGRLACYRRRAQHYNVH